MLSAAQAINKLKTTPGTFLRYNQVSIAGDPGASGVSQYVASMLDDIKVVKGKIVPRYDNYRPGKILGNLRKHGTRKVSIGPHGGGAVAVGATTFNAHSVQMVGEGATAIPAIAGYLLPVPSAHILMVTGMLTGCSFVVLDTGNGILAAHIQPNPGNAVGLRTSILANGHFAGHPGAAVSVYGDYGTGGGGGAMGYDHMSERITVTGAFLGGAWSIYAQAFNNNGTVTRVDRIL